MMKEDDVDYEKLRLDVLQKMVEERDIECKNNKQDIIKALLLYDNGKYIKETTYEKTSEGYVIGVDIKNKPHMSEVRHLIEKKDARCLNRYSGGRIHYISKQKLI